MEYSQVSKEQEAQILKGRIAGWESEHFGHQINLLALEANNATDAEKDSTLKALSTLEASIGALSVKLLEYDDTSDS